MDVKKEWLAKNPCTNQIIIAFLMEREEHFMKSCLAMEEEDWIRRELQNGNGPNGPRWMKIETWLQFYHTLCCDEVKVAYAEKDKILSRAELDAGF